MDGNGRNPWLVDDLDDFYFLCCPECTYKSKDDEAFMDHAVENHPKSKASSVFSEEELELSRKRTVVKYYPKGKNLLLAEEKLANPTKKLKKVVKVVSAPKNVDSIDMIKEEGTEEDQFIEYEDPDLDALESLSDEFINCKLIANYLFIYWKFDLNQ